MMKDYEGQRHTFVATSKRGSLTDIVDTDTGENYGWCVKIEADANTWDDVQPLDVVTFDADIVSYTYEVDHCDDPTYYAPVSVFTGWKLVNVGNVRRRNLMDDEQFVRDVARMFLEKFPARTIEEVKEIYNDLYYEN